MPKRAVFGIAKYLGVGGTLNGHIWSNIYSTSTNDPLNKSLFTWATFKLTFDALCAAFHML